nr:MAG: capsid protein precursor [Porcupine astrovirus 6]ULF47991.1 MAG: capsid protein precursor [Porcupine astrovirus 6]
MANRQQRRAPRTTTNIVVRNGTAASQARASGAATSSRRRRNRARRQPQVNVRVLAPQNKGRRRFSRRPGVGGRVVCQKINTTLGTVGSNGSEQIECELTCLMNPATMKEATGSNSFGPLGIYASTYSLFKMTRCNVTLKPLVGDSAVSGTVCRVSWNPTSSPSQTSWSALGARKHVDVTPGKTGRFILTTKDLVGPKGGWYKTNTKGDPMMSFAGTLEVHTLGKTMSTYQNNAFTGALFLAELETEWQFKDYAQQPGMLNLIKGEDTRQAQITTDGSGKLQLVVPNNTRMARAAANAASEIIWLVTDTVIQTGASLLPPPFGWLIRGGWWLVKRAAGAPVRTGNTTFDVYASISDARASMPCIADSANIEPITLGRLHFQQVTPGNTGISTDIPSTRATTGSYPTPTQCYVTTASIINMGNTPGTTADYVPAFCAWRSMGTSQNYSNGAGFIVDSQRVATYNLYKVTVSTDIGAIDPSMFDNRVPFYLLYNGTDARQVGYAVAAQFDHMDESPSLRVSSVLVYATSADAFNFRHNWRTTTVTYPVTHNNDECAAKISTTEAGTEKYLRIKFEPGNWYVAQFVVHGVVDRYYKVGNIIVASNAVSQISSEDNYFYPTVDDAHTGLLPVYISGLRLQVFTADQVVSDTETRNITQDLYPPSGRAAYRGGPYNLEEEVDGDDFPEPPAHYDSDLEGHQDLEMGPEDHYSDPPISRLVVRDDAFALYEHLCATHTERAARLAVNQLYPSDEYTEFTEVYHDALADGLSPKEARAQALGF